MKPLFLLSLSILTLTACQPDDVVDLVAPGNSCGSSGARVEATVEGSDWCANASVIGIGDGASITITGINLTGGTLIMQLDSLATGPRAITEADNAILYMDLGLPYTSLTTDPGTLTIATLDTVAHKVTGAFEVTLHADGVGAKNLSGSFDVVYTQQ